ncbi:hypothetical protein [Corallococcus carmarthensis]|uniref:hypothetical protein n=1 Tax=Corallococcus carmarthensis TaxID=2316728 RepID=UPI001315596F|nr:hypothetical protein [Corallococcus carmarthensis]NOK16354.1 hypothetical protein [Corallococcus carmarthensis]
MARVPVTFETTSLTPPTRLVSISKARIRVAALFEPAHATVYSVVMANGRITVVIH